MQEISVRSPIEAADDFILKSNRNKNVCAHPSSQSHTHMLTNSKMVVSR